MRGVVMSTIDFLHWCNRGSNPCHGNDIVIFSTYSDKCNVLGKIFSLLLASTQDMLGNLGSQFSKLTKHKIEPYID